MVAFEYMNVWLSLACTCTCLRKESLGLETEQEGFLFISVPRTNSSMLCREYTQDKKCPGSLESILEITPARSARMYREYYEAEHKETWQEVLVMSIWGWKPTGDKRIHVTDLFSLQRTA